MGFFFFFFLGNKIGPLSPMFSLSFLFFKKNYDNRPKKKEVSWHAQSACNKASPNLRISTLEN